VSFPQDDLSAWIAARLREMRLESGLGEAGAGDLARMSQSKVSGLELGRLRPAPADVRTLCEVYGAGLDETDDLVQLAGQLRDAASRSVVTLSRHPREVRQRVRQLEGATVTLRSYESALVPELLQTRDYARAVLAADGVPRSEVDKAAGARMEWQAGFIERIPRAVLIMSEGSLRWHVGSPRLMIEQVTEIIAVSRRHPHLEIGIVPYTTAVSVVPQTGWDLYDSGAVILRTAVGTAVTTDEDDIATHERLFGLLQDVAATDSAAHAVLARIVADYQVLDGQPPGRQDR
jgi:transcriptional regulator with XRE-family HTH domain